MIRRSCRIFIKWSVRMIPAEIIRIMYRHQHMYHELLVRVLVIKLHVDRCFPIRDSLQDIPEI